MLSGLINLRVITCPPMFIFIKFIKVFSPKILKYSSINFLSKFIQNTKVHPFSKVGKSVFRLQDDSFNIKDKPLFIPLKYI